MRNRLAHSFISGIWVTAPMRENFPGAAGAEAVPIRRWAAAPCHGLRLLNHPAPRSAYIRGSIEISPMYWLITLICTVTIAGALALVAGIDFVL